MAKKLKSAESKVQKKKPSNEPHVINSNREYKLNNEPGENEFFGYHPETGSPICAARARNPNKYGDHVCLMRPEKGRQRCRLHGGRSPRGEASPNYKHGNSSLYKSIPAHMMESYESARGNENLMQLDDDIALFTAYVDQLMGQLSTRESKAAWERLRDVHTALMEGLQAGDTNSVMLQMQQFDRLIRRGVGDAVVWDQITVAVDNRRKLVETNRRQYQALDLFLPIELVLEANRRILGAVMRELTDANARQRVLDEFNAAFPKPRGRQVEVLN